MVLRISGSCSHQVECFVVLDRGASQSLTKEIRSIGPSALRKFSQLLNLTSFDFGLSQKDRHFRNSQR